MDIEIGPELSIAQESIISSVRPWIGASLLVREQELRQFIARGVDDPRYELNEHVSDCGLFALAVWHDVGVDHHLCNDKYVSGMAIIWVTEIAHDLKAVRYPKRDGMPVPGALCHWYSRRPSKDDHVAFTLGPVADGTHFADYAGGGGAECAINSGRGDIRFSWGRPLQCWYDPNALLGFE